MRRFLITMYQKGKLENIMSRYMKYIEYEKTSNKSTQIVSIDYEGIEEEFKKEKGEYGGGGAFLSNPTDHINHVLGIDKNSLYKLRSELREIKENDKEGYCSLEFSHIDNETEKAYYCKKLNMWIPKSQTIRENDILYIKRWIIQNNY